MNNLEQKFYERVPGLLHDISKSLEAIAGKKQAEKPEVNIWVLFAESLYDYQLEGRLIRVFYSEDEARKAYDEEVKTDRKAAEERQYEINEDNDFFEAYPDGSWGTSHMTVELKKCKIGEPMWCRE